MGHSPHAGTGRRVRRKIEGQGDLFAAGELFPVRRPVEDVRAVDLSLRIKTAMGLALKQCPDSAAVVAAHIAEMTGREMTADALYTYTAVSKPEHDIGLTRFVAFVRATNAFWLWDVLVEDDGLMVLQGREAKLAQVGLLQQQLLHLGEELKSLKRELGDQPVEVAPVRSGGRR